MATYQPLHDWSVTPTEAVALQQQLRSQIRIEPLSVPSKTIAGCDISFNKFEETVYAGIVVLRLDTLETIDEAGVVGTAPFPYIPGLLSFREIPALLKAWQTLQTEPDVVMFDGHGTAHPRRIGIASHAGLFLDRPTFGCGKSVLVGKYDEPAPERGAWSPMKHYGEVIGAALRTKNKVNPVYVSPGHLIDLPTAISLTLQCDGGYRIPEPTRRAHNLVNALRRGERIVS
ncbi:MULTISPECIES: deoxyribonuclease V [unclassified Spirosoma]|uniref:deoxyribonuclease V n=1 Tax=unclassified Spirosoma TaxID=2621999 RepID=UPI00096365A1|nr:MULTISPECIES: deoxyribonuclease V [unclassified Spirosoma]MBN8820574.1 deoxyribonuclease V [Spirosoma sp.]OJW71091.1 MAG: endonuclease V [Spirosoma sp. 48-14]